jgi:hypothetical protein
MLPSISLPKGGGAIRGMGEKFSVNPVTGTGSLNIPIYASPRRSGFGPQLSLSFRSHLYCTARECHAERVPDVRVDGPT